MVRPFRYFRYELGSILALRPRADQFRGGTHGCGVRMAEGQEDRERRSGGGGLIGGLCLRMVDGEPHLFQPPDRREAAEIGSVEAGQAPNGPIIAIVDAYDAPNVAADLAVYNAHSGIPALPSCAVPIASSPTPCFQKVDQRGRLFVNEEGRDRPQTRANAGPCQG